MIDTAQAMCLVASDLLALQGPSPQDVVLAAEAAGLAASVLLAQLERMAPSGGELALDVPCVSHAISLPVALYDGLVAALGGQEPSERPDLSSVPGAPESLIGAAEALLRLSAALVQQLGLPAAAAGAVQGPEEEEEVGPYGRERAGACCAMGIEAAMFLLHCTSNQGAGSQTGAAASAATGGAAASGAAASALSHCTSSLAKAARTWAALPAEQQGAVAAWAQDLGQLWYTFAVAMHSLLFAVAGPDQQR